VYSKEWKLKEVNVYNKWAVDEARRSYNDEEKVL